jgi:type II secretory pathway pseudopilin PulG
MVVVGIISILASVLFLSFSDARESSRDRALMSELKSTQLAIELYKAQTGSYPAESANLPVGLVPDFIAELPTANDSANTNCTIEYQVPSDQTWYKLTAIECASDNTVIDVGNEMARCPISCGGTGVCSPSDSEFSSSFAVYSYGGECE